MGEHHSLPSGRRIALYSHDTQGLGHIRRNLSLASALVEADPETNILIITGNPEAGSLPRPPHTEIVAMPTVAKNAKGAYGSRTLTVDIERVVEMRKSLIKATLRDFDPDLLIVDKVPLGFRKELDATLRKLKHRHGTRVVLGLREILDTPEVAKNEWDVMRTSWAIKKYYDAVWIYGDQRVYDTIEEYDLHKRIKAKVTFTGYLGEGRFAAASKPSSGVNADVPTEPYALCLCGGGQDGAEMAADFIRGVQMAGKRGIVVTGPFMPERARAELNDALSQGASVEVRSLVSNVPELIAGAECVVSMAGYNSTCEVLAAGRPTLLIPRVIPRLEQSLRANRLAELGYVTALDPRSMSPERIAAWLRNPTLPEPRVPIALNGLEVVPKLAAELIDSGREIQVQTDRHVDFAESEHSRKMSPSNHRAPINEPSVPVSEQAADDKVMTDEKELVTAS